MNFDYSSKQVCYRNRKKYPLEKKVTCKAISLSPNTQMENFDSKRKSVCWLVS